MTTRKPSLLRNLPIRSKLLLGYIGVFLLALGLGGTFLYLSVRETLEANIEAKLRTSTQGIHNLVKIAVDASVRNHLRAVAETNAEIVRYHWHQSRKGTYSEAEAKRRATKELLSQVIGKTGYLYALNSKGVLQVHPKQPLVGKDVSRFGFVKRQVQSRHGYLEYDWANPGEKKKRAKALYMTYFGPWDWIISASSYREEFVQLLSVADLRESILSMTFGKTGYPYVINTKGRIVIHPKLDAGTSLWNSTDSRGVKFVQEICRRKSGKIIYDWRNPDETHARKKLAIFSHYPELGWIVASSSYLDEFYEPLEAVGVTMLVTVGVVLVLILPTTILLGRSITKPLGSLMRRFARGAEGDYSGRMEPQTGGELGQLAVYYNSFMERLERSREELAASAAKYRSILDNAVEGIFQSTPTGELLSANPSMAAILGYGSSEQLLAEVNAGKHSLYTSAEDRQRLIEQLDQHGSLAQHELQLRRRDGGAVWVAINATAVYDDDQQLSRMVCFLTDISERHDYEEAQQLARVELQARTAELSGWVQELERRNLEADHLRELGDHLQVCRQINETFPVIAHYLSKLFPKDIATLYIRGDANEALHQALTTRSGPSTLSSLPAEDCWALRKVKPHLTLPGDDGLSCAHLGQAPPRGSLCHPLIAQDELVGMLHLLFGEAEPGQEERERERKIRLGTLVSEHLSLALTNIQLRDSLRSQSIHDVLTGLYNRRHMETALRRELARCRRDGSRISLVMLDVDHFKQVNDTYGHDVGDNVLRDLSNYLRASIRAEDVACRFGGEEFVLIMIGTDQAGAATKAKTILEGMRSHVQVRRGKEVHPITASFGVASAPLHGESPEQLLEAADAALYKAKAAGRNRVVVAA